MQDREWKEILGGINTAQDLNDKNIINKIKGALNRKHLNVYKEWEKKQFNINHLFSFKTKYTHNVCTLLHISTRCGLRNLVKILLQIGVDVNAIDHRHQETSLHRVASHANMADLLARGAGVDFMYKSERTPLHWAAESGHTSIVEALLTKGAHVNAIDRDRAIPLHFAAKNGHQDIVKTLLENCANINYIYRSGKTSLHLAAESGHANIVKVLLENCANVNYIDIDEKTPLHWAAENGHIKAIKVLLKKGASPFMKDKNDHTPQDLARNDSIKRLLEKAEKKQRLKPIVIIGIVTSILITCETTFAVSHIKNGYVPDGIAFIMIIIITVLAFCFLIYNKTFKPNTRVNEAQTREICGIEISVV